jgi:transposase
MFDWEPPVLLRHHLEQGLSKTVIAERIGISRRWIYKWIARGSFGSCALPGRAPCLPA